MLSTNEILNLGGLGHEGIYSSHLAAWRNQRQLVDKALLIERKRGLKADPVAAQDRIVLELKDEVERPRGKLATVHLIIDVQKNFPSCWG